MPFYFTSVKYNFQNVLVCRGTGCPIGRTIGIRRASSVGGGLMQRSSPYEPSTGGWSSDGFERSGLLGKRCLHACGRHGKFSETAAGRMSEGVGQGGRSRWKRTLTRPQRRIAPIHQNNLDAGDLRKRKYRIPGPVPARDLPSVEGNLLLQSETDRLQDASFELIYRAIGIDHASNIGRHHNSRDLDDASLAVDFHIRHCGRIHPDALVSTKCHAASISAIALLS